MQGYAKWRLDGLKGFKSGFAWNYRGTVWDASERFENVS